MSSTSGATELGLVQSSRTSLRQRASGLVSGKGQDDDSCCYHLAWPRTKLGWKIRKKGGGGLVAGRGADELLNRSNLQDHHLGWITCGIITCGVMEIHPWEDHLWDNSLGHYVTYVGTRRGQDRMDQVFGPHRRIARSRYYLEAVKPVAISELGTTSSGANSNCHRVALAARNISRCRTQALSLVGHGIR